MTDVQQVEEHIEEQVDHDEEYAEAYSFWIYAFAVIGAVVGYNLGAEAGFGFLPNLGFGFVGLVVLSMVAYRFRRVISIVGGVAVLIAIVMAVIEGIQSAG